jgi:DNA-binding HxlR family transcriptional regulator
MAQGQIIRELLPAIAAILGTSPEALTANPDYGSLARIVCDMYTNGRVHEEFRAEPVRAILTSVGDRWTALLMQLLEQTPLRFSMLHRIIRTILEEDISRQILSMKLHALERDGFVRRTNLGGARPAVEYALTPAGCEFAAQIRSLVEWARSTIPAIRVARANYAARNGASLVHLAASGSAVTPESG